MTIRTCALAALALAGSLPLATGCRSSDEAADAAAGAETATSLHDVQPLDVNDVSILFADTDSGEPFPNLHVGDSLWPQAIFDQVTAFTSKASITLHPEAKQRASWRVVGFRFDPCARTPDFQGGIAPAAPGIVALHHGLAGAGEACSTMQLRLSVQPMMGKNLIDTAAHLIFNLAPSASPEPFVQKLLAIKKASKVATSGKPLGVHPGLTGATPDPVLGRAISDFVTSTVASSTLFSVAFVGLGSPNPGRPDGSPWTFFGGFVGPSGWAPAPPTTFDLTHGKPVTFGSAPAVTFTGAAGDGILVGQTKLGDALAAIGLTTSDIATTQPLVVAADPDDPDSAGGPPPTAAEAARVHRIDNPLTNNVLVSDCTSCHTSSPATSKLQVPDDPATRFSVPKGLTGYASVDARQTGADDYVVRSFGYMPSIAVADGGDGKNHPIVSNRAATDSALVADIVNRQILKLPGNGALDCSAPAVWSCFAFSGSSDRECLAKCR